MPCGYNSLLNYDPEDCEWFAMKCKRWSCPECRKLRQAQLWELAESGKPNAFITLTVGPDAPADNAEAARGLVHAWRMILQRAKREHRVSHPQYLCVFEQTKKRRPHLHILWRGPFLPQAWLSMLMDKYLSSPIVDIRAVRSVKRAARYVSKYVSKAPQQWKGTKRYWRSLAWRIAGKDAQDTPAADKGRWYPVWISPWCIADAFERCGWQVTHTDAGHWRAVETEEGRSRWPSEMT